MRKIKRRIKVKGVSYEIWLGIVKKSAGKNHFLKLYYYPGDPEDENNKPVALKSAFKSEDEAIEYGKKFMIDLYENALSRS